MGPLETCGSGGRWEIQALHKAHAPKSFVRPYRKLLLPVDTIWGCGEIKVTLWNTIHALHTESHKPVPKCSWH